jgi:N1-aminopropylagmatine ureohydrolase
LSDYRHPERFLGLDDQSSQRESSAAWMLPIPLDMTTSYLGGTRLGPSAIIEASNQVELYDIEFGVEAAPVYGVAMLPFLHPSLSSARDAVESIRQAVADLPLEDRVLVTLGGEHTITVGLVSAFAARYPDMIVVQIDAHSDLRDSFDGTPYSHACTARRLLDYAPVLQFGIRCLCEEEVVFARQSERVTMWTAEAMHRDTQRLYLAKLREAVAGRPVYLTLDLDGLDPSIMPAVGTPEPGGIGWYDCIDLIRAVAGSSHVFAFDCVELCPVPGSHASAFAAARLVYKTLNHVMAARGKLPAAR